MRFYILKNLLFGGLLLLLLHFETLNIGPFKVSHLWKGVLLLYIIFKLLNKKNSLLIYRPLLFLAILQIVNIEIFNNPINAIIQFSTILILPLLGIYVFNFTYSQLQNALMFFASFFILSFIPYQLGILTSFEDGYALHKYGGGSGLIGPFQNPHSASLTLAFSLIVIANFWFSKKFNKIFLILLFVFGFYFLINTYVRTGLAMLVIGLLILVFYYGKKSPKSFLKVVVTSSLLMILRSSWVLTNDILINRIKGEGQYGNEDKFEKYGSGRGAIYLASVETFYDASLLEKIFGMGSTELADKNYQKLGIRIGSHNAFFDTLLANGIVGLLLFLSFIYKIFLLLRKQRSKYYPLLTALFLAFLIMSFFQGFERITVNLLLFLAVASTIRINQNYENKNN